MDNVDTSDKTQDKLDVLSAAWLPEPYSVEHFVSAILTGHRINEIISLIYEEHSGIHTSVPSE